MKTRPIHKNLNTSFINLSALLRHLRERKFVGVVHLEMRDYEADVFLPGKNKIEARERDSRAGRVSVGPEVLERLLIRAREPNGLVSVYQSIEEESPPKQPGRKLRGRPVPRPAGEPVTRPAGRPVKDPAVPELEIALPPISEKAPNPTIEAPEIELRIKEPAPPARDKPVSLKANPITMGKSPVKPLETLPSESESPVAKPVLRSAFAAIREKLALPFSLTRQKKSGHTAEEREELLELTGELLAAVEDSMNRSKLNFAWAFDKARTEMLPRYPFLDPQAGVFEYADGRASLSAPLPPTLLAEGITGALRNMLEKIEAYPKFAGVHRTAVKNLRELIAKRRAGFDKFSLTEAIEKMIGDN